MSDKQPEPISIPPNWNEPATKGDVARLGVYISSCMMDLAGAIVALRHGENSDARDRIAAFLKDDHELNELINELTGEAADD